MAAIRAVERLASREGLGGYGARVAEMVSALLAARLDPVVIAQLVARLNDALLRPILRWAEADLGPAPAPWAWLALGSEGRMEQTLLTDQDNALVFADEGAGARGWFQAFAGRVNDDLEAAGFPRCPGGYMARSWLGTLGRVARALPRPGSTSPARRGCSRRPSSSTTAGWRAGSTSRRSRRRSADAGDQPIFLRAMAEEALRFAPPADAAPAHAGRVVGGRSQEARHLAHRLPGPLLRARGGHAAPGTPSTGIDAAERAGLLDAETGGNVSEAYRFLVGLRLRLQLRTLVAGRPVVDEVALSELTPVERTRLKESFRAVKAWQDLAAYHHRL